jgi:hypothetical protein
VVSLSCAREMIAAWLSEWLIPGLERLFFLGARSEESQNSSLGRDSLTLNDDPGSGPGFQGPKFGSTMTLGRDPVFIFPKNVKALTNACWLWQARTTE